MNQKTVTFASIIAVVFWCIFIFYMSAKTAPDSTELSMGVVNHVITYVVPGYQQMDLPQQLYWQDELETPIRKLAHFAEFAALAILALNAAFQIAKLKCGEAQLSIKLTAAAWATATFYAATDELHQMFVPGRACLATDVCIDAAGALFGLLVAWGIRSLWRAKRQRDKEPSL